MSNTRPRTFGEQIGASVQRTARGVSQGAGLAVEVARLAQSGRDGGQPSVARATPPPAVPFLTTEFTDPTGVESVELPVGHLWLIEARSIWDVGILEPSPTPIAGLPIPVVSYLSLGYGVDERHYLIFENTEAGTFGTSFHHHVSSHVTETFTVTWGVGVYPDLSAVPTGNIVVTARWLRPLTYSETITP